MGDTFEITGDTFEKSLALRAEQSAVNAEAEELTTRSEDLLAHAEQVCEEAKFTAFMLSKYPGVFEKLEMSPREFRTLDVQSAISYALGVGLDTKTVFYLAKDSFPEAEQQEIRGYIAIIASSRTTIKSSMS